MKNFLKYSAFIFTTICLGVLMILGAGKIYSSFDPWPKEKKEAYEFYRLKREIISNPEILSKIIVETRTLSEKKRVVTFKPSHVEELIGYPLEDSMRIDTWGYQWVSDTITPSEVNKISTYPQPEEIIIKIPYSKWGKYNKVEEDDYFMSSLVQGKPEGQKWGCWHYLFAEINGGTYVMSGVIKLFSEKSPGDELRITKTSYDLNHKEVNSLVDIDPIPILREMRKELKRI